MLDRRQFFGATAAIAVGVLAGCASAATESATVALVVENAWVRTTEGAANKMMTAAFMSIVNPGDAEVKLLSATCDGAGKVELHHVVERDGQKVMEPVPDIPVPGGSHVHLTPGGLHIMLMQLGREFKLGDEIEMELTFSTGQKIKVLAPVKQMAEEGEHYHPGDPTPGQMGSPAMTPSMTSPGGTKMPSPTTAPAPSTSARTQPSMPAPTSTKTGRY